jgi:hypothetical protein
VYLLRVTPSIQTINDPAAYEFYGGKDQDGRPVWTHDFQKIKPLLEWDNNMGCVTATWNPVLKKYLMCVTDGGDTISRMNTYLLEADRLDGDWRIITYMKDFGVQAYFVNIPSKFISGGGNTFWLCYSANFSSGWGGTTFESRPPGSRYAMCLQEVRLITPSDPVAPPGPLTSPANIAPLATVTVTSTHGDYSVRGLTDGVVGGYPGDISQEWCSNGERGTATIRLTWNEEQTIDRVWLFDRRNELDQIRSGLLVFSDGSTIPTGELPDDAKQGLQVKFPPKRVKWLVFIPNEVKPSTLNIGLAEIGVFRSH